MKQIRTIAGRWREHAAASGMTRSLSAREQTLAMLVFYAGFSAALEAGLEIAEHLSDEDGSRAYQLLYEETQMLEAMASRLATPPASGLS